MTPPPMTAMVFGISLISNAPVESTTLPPALSTGTGGSGVTSDPDAMRMFLVESVSLPPSFNATPTELGPDNVPYQKKHTQNDTYDCQYVEPYKPLEDIDGCMHVCIYNIIDSYLSLEVINLMLLQ